MNKTTLEEYLKKHLPSDHNEQDKIYLKARYNWYHGKKVEGKDYYEAVSRHYAGTTFQLNNKHN